LSVEERLNQALEATEEEGIPMPTGYDRSTRSRETLKNRHNTHINEFLGSSNIVNVAVILPHYYSCLLTFAVHRYMETQGFNIIRTLGYRFPEATYTQVNFGNRKSQNLLKSGIHFIAKNETRFIVTVDVSVRPYSSVVISGSASYKDKVTEFANGVTTTAKTENYLKGAKLEFGDRIEFLNLADRNWRELVLEPGIRKEIFDNTLGYFDNSERLIGRLGLHSKRGLLLVGQPGVGKTLIIKALINEAKGVTCLLAHAYSLDEHEYICDLYRLAQDLSPTIVVIEDVDMIAQDRVEFGYSRGPALLSLLAVLDGIQEQKQVITVGTTNNFEKMDAAMVNRPGRFDVIIKIPLPLLEERKQLVELVSERIPIQAADKEYISRKAEGCSPAQIKEIIHRIAISHCARTTEEQQPINVTAGEIDSIISKINGKNGHRLGFCTSNGNNGRGASLSVNIQ